MSLEFGQSAAIMLALPALQAVATISILNKQKQHYDAIAAQRIGLIDKAVNNFVTAVNAQLASGAFEKAYGSVPEAVLYEKVDVKENSLQHLEDELAALPASKRYIEAANRVQEQEWITRMLVLDARFLCNMESISCTISELLNGRMPVGDVIEIVKDGAEMAAMTGRIGNVAALTARDLGISRLRAKVAGQTMADGHIDRLNKAVPQQMSVSIRDFINTPAGRLGLAISEAQLIQQSLQNAENAKAAGDPAEYGKLQARLQELVLVLGNEAQRGNMINQFTPNYAAILAPAIDSISQALIGSGNPLVDSADAGYSAGKRGDGDK